MITIKTKDGEVIPNSKLKDIENTKFDIKVRTSDKRIVFWVGRAVLSLYEALNIADQIPEMEPGYSVICLQEI